jgi:hypothetical protein
MQSKIFVHRAGMLYKERNDRKNYHAGCHQESTGYTGAQTGNVVMIRETGEYHVGPLYAHVEYTPSSEQETAAVVLPDMKREEEPRNITQ